MRLYPAMLALVATTALLASCGKKEGAPEQAAAPTAPPTPTPEQIKAMLATLPAPYNAGDVDNGKRLFVQCAACHTFVKGGPVLTGPNLYGVFGRKAGGLSGYTYSDGVKALGYTWDAPHIDTWITNPKALVPETKMTFVGIKDAKDRVDVVAYLKVATSPQ